MKYGQRAEQRPFGGGEELIAFLGALAVTALMGLVFIREPRLALVVLLLPLLALPLVYFYRPQWALYTFILILPVHSLLMTLLLSQVGAPPSAVRLVAAWKELLLAGTFAAIIVRILVRGHMPRPVWVDAVVVGWIGLLALHVLVMLIVGSNRTIVAVAYGLRDWMLYLIPYILGRVVFFSEEGVERALWLIALMGFITSLYGIIEYFFLPIEWHVQLGVPVYFRNFLGLRYDDYLFGLPPNYWAEVAGNTVRRAVSTYLSGQGFAVSFVLVLPVVAYRYLARPGWQTLSVLCVCGAGLLLSITRMTIIVCFIQLLLLLLLFPRHRLLIGVLVIALMLFCGGLVASERFRTFVYLTLTFQDTSSSTRPAQWAQGLRLLAEFPLGLGPGSGGQAGARFGTSGFGTEAGYFKLTSDLGLPGLLLLMGLFAGILGSAFQLVRRSAGAWRGLGLVVLVIGVGFLLNNVTAPPDQHPFVMYVFLWLAGFSVRAATALPMLSRAVAPAPATAD